METITTVNDIRVWIENNNPNNVLSTPDRIDRLVEALRTAEHPPWGTDWEAWLNTLTSDEMPGTSRNSMPGATSAERLAARAAWAAADTMTQEERNDRARREGRVVERDQDGHVKHG